MTNNLDLLSSLNRVEVPIINIKVGNYTFGKYTRESSPEGTIIKYPNFIKSVYTKKINGTVNTYNIVMVYPITERDDPNFMEKVFSSISRTREMVLTYGDASAPLFLYKEEKVLVQGIKPDVDIASSRITYYITAVGAGFQLNSSKYSFEAKKNVKVSDVIIDLLYRDYKELLDVFPGMRNKELVISKGLIPRDDKPVDIEKKYNISLIDYLTYLVSCMIPMSNNNTTLVNGFYNIHVVDTTTELYRDTLGNNLVFEGAYFKITKIEHLNYNDSLDVYSIDVGYPTKDIVLKFSIDNEDSFSILYDYQESIEESKYVQRINDNGEFEQVFSPAITSGNNYFITRPEDKTWWTKITEFPTKATIVLKGLLKPAIMMNYVRVNVYFYGRKYVGTGLYVILSQVDEVSASGFRTTLQLLKVGGDNTLSQ